MEKFLLSKHDMNVIKKFFEPEVDHVQMYTISKEVARFLQALGYEPTKESTDELWYFEIPNRFRNAVITRTVSEQKYW